MKNFIKKFNDIYEILYCNEGIINYEKAILKFDNLVKNDSKEIFKTTLAEFINTRKDCISSDREAAAFIIAFNYFNEEV